MDRLCLVKFGVISILRVGIGRTGSCNRGEIGVISSHLQGRCVLGGDVYTMSLAREQKCFVS